MKREILAGARALVYKSLSTLTLEPCSKSNYLNEAVVSLALSFKVMSDFKLSIQELIGKLEELAESYDWSLSREFEREVCIEYKFYNESRCVFKERFYTAKSFRELESELMQLYSRINYRFNGEIDDLGVELGFMEKASEVEYEFLSEQRSSEAMDIVFLEKLMLENHIIPFSSLLRECVLRFKRRVYSLIIDLVAKYACIDKNVLEQIASNA